MWAKIVAEWDSCLLVSLNCFCRSATKSAHSDSGTDCKHQDDLSHDAGRRLQSNSKAFAGKPLFVPQSVGHLKRRFASLGETFSLFKPLPQLVGNVTGAVGWDMGATHSFPFAPPHKKQRDATLGFPCHSYVQAKLMVLSGRKWSEFLDLGSFLWIGNVFGSVVNFWNRHKFCQLQVERPKMGHQGVQVEDDASIE